MKKWHFSLAAIGVFLVGLAHKLHLDAVAQDVAAQITATIAKDVAQGKSIGVVLHDAGQTAVGSVKSE